MPDGTVAQAPQIESVVEEQYFASEQYQAPGYQQQQYQDSYQAQYAAPQTQYQEPQQMQYQQYAQAADPYQAQPVQQPVDTYVGGQPSAFDTQQMPVDPMAFLNDDGNEGGNQNG